ncbi:uncharacterized protein FIBRA_09465 [Fibroporia radiculosa]|uniref:Uncharacterized protein n=1 Tax=Fibroporia radiculosa TaxID=599839 RepID=J7S6I2_9APHY|nr:uncharacterized protein FIBRA_09465 [Fibroporia radiculosa]CCM07129.1 predicted protein [Fibroporia radiculosa]
MSPSNIAHGNPKEGHDAHPQPDHIIPPGDDHVVHPEHPDSAHIDVLKNVIGEHVPNSNKVVVRGVTQHNTIPFNVILYNYLDISGSINGQDLDVDIVVNLIIPIIGKREIGKIHGNVRDGLTLNVNVHRIATGKITFKLEHKNQLWADVALKTEVGNWNKSEHLIDGMVTCLDEYLVY